MANSYKKVTLSELKRVVESTIERLPKTIDPDDVPVLVDLAEPSIGARASTPVTFAGMGFDWEHGQFRVHTAHQIVKRGNALEDVKPILLKPYDGRNYYWCPRCESKLTKDDRFCRYCGQRLK